MKTLKLLLGFALVAALFTSCYTDDVYINNHNPLPEPSISLNQLLSSYELWYVDINQTAGYGQIPFLQMAFTVSYRNGTLYANNNLVGIGNQGSGFGIPIGNYTAYGNVLDVNHLIDGFSTFDVYQINSNTIELHEPYSNTSYFLKGYQRSNFDYDFVFYDNIHYFLQEYEAWEKTYVSQSGSLNDFDNENYLQFLTGGNDSEFRSSTDYGIMNPANIYWDYLGVYAVNNIPGNLYLKTLILNYDMYGNEFFQLTVINDQRIRLFHTTSGTTYEFTGRGYIQFMRTAEGKQAEVRKFRKFKSERKENLRENSRT
ncbi:MAG: nicotinic acid mononucleotide adenyltransferase [Xanthomarina sp.]